MMQVSNVLQDISKRGLPTYLHFCLNHEIRSTSSTDVFKKIHLHRIIRDTRTGIGRNFVSYSTFGFMGLVGSVQLWLW